MEAKFETVINSHKGLPHVEVEMRLGHIQGHRFDTNVGEQDFKFIMKGLRKYEGWDSIKESVKHVYYEGNKRHSTDISNDNEESIEKKNVKNIDHKEKKFDIRLSVSQEFPADVAGEDVEFDRFIVKDRVSFVRKKVSIDMTVISGDPDDLDDEEDKQYQVELELIDVDKLNVHELRNSIHKVVNIMEMFGK